MKKETNKLLLKEWMDYQPYEAPSSVDHYYFNISKKVYKIMYKPEYDDLFYDDEEKITDCKFISCTLTGYFEDVISNIGVWKVFTAEHQKLYKKYIPFYQLNEKYLPDEINYEDVCFLLWYYLSCLYVDDVFNPLDEIILELALDVFKLFEEEYEYAPENKRITDFLNISDTETDYYKIRARIEWIVMNSYLFRLIFSEYFEEMDKVSNDKEISVETQEAYAKEIYDNTIINTTLPLLVFKGKDVLAGILGTDHSLYNDIKSISNRKTGSFLYKNHDSNFIYLEHISSEKIIPVTRKSFKLTNNISKNDVIIISLVNWQKEWWFSGVYSSFPHDKDYILKQKNHIESRNLFDDNIEKLAEAVLEHYKIFLRYNNNSPIALFSNGIEVNDIIKDFNIFWNKSLNLSKKELKKAKKERLKRDILEDKEENFQTEFDNVPGIVFFNKKSGIELLFGYNHLIPVENNPYYDPDFDVEEVIDLFMSKDSSSDFVRYLVEKYDINKIQFPGENKTNLLKDNLDFMLRFWKRKDYSGFPKISFV